ncbi:hypothetical protein B0T24DRAFT_549681, partial [Lasiosphaeria ovina]
MHNVNHSHIYRLPDKLVLRILRYLGHDTLTLLYLRRVSRRFRRIIYEPEIWEAMGFGPHTPFLSSFIRSEFECSFPRDLKEELWRRIQKDGICDECRMRRLGAPHKPNAGWLRSPNLCPVMSRSPLGLHCDGCSSSSSSSGSHDAHPCLGRHGAVRLCEHVKISWADIEPYLSEWWQQQQQQDPQDGQACLDGFGIECRDPSHDFRCSAEDAPT